MPVVRDFRDYSFSEPRIERCGRYLGRRSYWKLYAIENLLRTVLHSVLSTQIGANWWNLAVDPKVRNDANETRKRYARNPQHTVPGTHDIYYVYLSSLNNIIRTNSNQFLPIVPDIDQWVSKIESILIPRNLVGHMNFPNQADRERIDRLHQDIYALVTCVQRAGISIRIPV